VSGRGLHARRLSEIETRSASCGGFRRTALFDRLSVHDEVVFEHYIKVEDIGAENSPRCLTMWMGEKRDLSGEPGKHLREARGFSAARAG